MSSRPRPRRTAPTRVPDPTRAARFTPTTSAPSRKGGDGGGDGAGGRTGAPGGKGRGTGGNGGVGERRKQRSPARVGTFAASDQEAEGCRQDRRGGAGAGASSRPRSWPSAARCSSTAGATPGRAV